jgi:hypothetical protein
MTNGVRHGFFCLGRCWLLMALLFVGGLMNLLWIAALALLVLIEKTLPWGGRMSRVTGAALVAWGAATLVSAYWSGPHDSPHFPSAQILRRFAPIPYQIGGFLGWMRVMRMAAAELRDCGRLKDIRAFIDDLYGHDLHAKRVDSLAAATLGVMTGASLAVAMIGQALAQARGLVTKHAIKQIDRLLSNGGIDVWESFARWVPHLVGSCTDIVVAMDWTDFDGDDQATLALNLVTGHGRAMPLLWLSVWKDALKDQRNDIEDTCLRRLSEVVPPGCRVTILADRGFGDHKLFAYLADLGFAYVIRLPRQHPCHRCLRRDANRGALGWQIGPGAQAARRPRHRVARLSGRRCGVCART